MNGHGETRTCIRCRQAITPRGGRTPVFCAVCGHRFPNRGHVQHRFGSSKTVSTRAIVALIVSLGAIIPMCGFPIGIVAILLAMSAREEVRKSPETTGGNALTVIAIVFGVLGALLQMFIICAGML